MSNGYEWESEELQSGEAREPLTPEERRRVEAEEERREAERAAALAQQRALLQDSAGDEYVNRRVEAEFAARRQLQEEELDEERRRAGGAGESNHLLLLFIGLLVAIVVLAVVYLSTLRGGTAAIAPLRRPATGRRHPNIAAGRLTRRVEAASFMAKSAVARDDARRRRRYSDAGRSPSVRPGART